MKFKLCLLILIFTTGILNTATAIDNSDGAIQALPAILPILLNSEAMDPTNCPDVDDRPITLADGFSTIDAGSLENFSGVTKVNGSLTIQIGDLPTEINSNSDLSALDSIVEVTGNIFFQIGTQNNPNTIIEVINTFNCLKRVGFVLSLSEPEITGDTGVIEFLGFENLESAGSILILSHDDLERIPAFNNLTETLGNGIGIFISENPSLQSISGFESLTTSDGIRIDFMDSLEEITGFESLTQTGDITITDNPLLDCPANVTTQLLPANITENNLVDCPIEPI